MKKMLTKSLAVFLSMVMIITAIPTSVFAVNENEGDFVSSVSDDLTVQPSGTNALNNIITESVEEEYENQTVDYIINWVEAEGTSVTVEFSCYDTCTLVVAIYTESGRMIGSANMDVTSDMNTATLNVSVKSLPEYYLIKAFLLDKDMYAKCDEYVCEYYTRSYQEFLALTVDDFPEESVINLDESKDNNFAVVKGDAVIINSSENFNVLLTKDDENLVYTFENPDEKLKALSKSDVLFYSIDDFNYILVMVSNAEIKGNIITVYGECEATEEDLFSCIKIDFTSNSEDTKIDISSMDPEISYSGEIAYNQNGVMPLAAGWEEEKEAEEAIINGFLK